MFDAKIIKCPCCGSNLNSIAIKYGGKRKDDSKYVFTGELCDSCSKKVESKEYLRIIVVKDDNNDLGSRISRHKFDKMTVVDMALLRRDFLEKVVSTKIFDEHDNTVILSLEAYNKIKEMIENLKSK